MAQASGERHSGESLSIMKVTPQDERLIVLSTDAQDAEGRLAPQHSAYFENLSPPLQWTRIEGAAAYAIIVEDPDAPRETPFLHWAIWNIPGHAISLSQGIEAAPEPSTPAGAKQGRNDAGEHGWFGPRPPVGHGVHRYYFQLFALDKELAMGPDTPLAELLNALKGHTIAEGKLMAMFEAPQSQ